MKQILQNLKTGATLLAEVPVPAVMPGMVLIQTRFTLVSKGTEKMLVDFGRASLLGKVLSQPDRARQVLERVRLDGLIETLSAVSRRMDEPISLGYCNVGMVMSLGRGVSRFSIGDRVASNGPHAEIVAVPESLCVKVPLVVSDEEASFAVVGAIALQGIRLVDPSLGETIAVLGLGLIGQLTAQLLGANGCRVLGFDLDPIKVSIARGCGVDASVLGGEGDPVARALSATAGVGVDGVVIAASSDSDEVVSQAARMCRKRGRIVLVGVTGLQLNRADFYEKELSFQVSCSYGPGRYETAFEEKGLDYPIGFVRWTENRNFQAVLEAMATGKLDAKPLISRRVPIERFKEVYDDLGAAGIASLFVYGPSPSLATGVSLPAKRFEAGGGTLAVVGAGNFAKMTLMPMLADAKARVKYVVSAGGASATHLASKYGVPNSTTDLGVVLGDKEVGGVIITTRHNLHARQSVDALRAGKHVLVEKPLCLTSAELEDVESAIQSSAGTTVTVGFNRRFSPHARKIRELLGDKPQPLSITATINAGTIPLKSWVHDPEIGGGRLVGEACHFLDLALFVAASPIVGVCAASLDSGAAPAGDSASILLRHANGSVSAINYLANGHRDCPKERIEIFSQERVLVLDNFRILTGYGFRRFKKLKTRPDKGHAAQFAEFARRVREGGEPLIPWEEIRNVTKATLAIGESLRSGGWVKIES